jgi:hypothetical protein
MSCSVVSSSDRHWEAMLYHVLDRMPVAIMSVYGKDTQDTMDDQIDAMRLGFCTAATLIRRKAVPAQICVACRASSVCPCTALRRPGPLLRRKGCFVSLDCVNEFTRIARNNNWGGKSPWAGTAPHEGQLRAKNIIGLSEASLVIVI